MPQIKQTTVYTFDELSESAKERARNWWREGAFDYEWYEHVYTDATDCLALAGFEVEKIWFSGFASQGDGACFDGTWNAARAQPVKAMKAHAPMDKALHRIAAEMRRIAKSDKNAFMRVRHSGHYYHSGCTSFEIDARTQELDESIREAARSAMDWIYRQLEAEYEYQSADEQVDDNIRANEYTFDENGKIA